ncbi:MAG: ribosomal protein L11 methyltransferase [Chloroflexi bacterium 44-23]|nr:MAG: ribosomal protein L11 methyltransferase [Chloroflexi bacterium 44-23]
MDDSQAWLEIMVSCDAELAESISEVFSRYVTHGVVTETEVKYDDAEETLLDYGPVKVMGYIAYDGQIEATKQKIESALGHLRLIQPIPQPIYRKIEDQNWMESWKKFYNPVLIGEKLLILPPWIENPNPERLAIKIDPSLAFGTGMHPTTQMCLSLAEPFLHPGINVIDIGCGSGILSIAAAKLGATRVLAVDVDRTSVETTLSNAIKNEVGSAIETGAGSVEEIINGDFSIQHAPVVMINILAPVIIRLFDDGLANLVEDDGYLIVSGILDYYEDEIQSVVKSYGFELIGQRMIKDWVGLAFHKHPKSNLITQ